MYTSCNQFAKDLINSILINEACQQDFSNESDCIVTLDAEQNGSSLAFRTKFKGLISVPQLDARVACEQTQSWKEHYPNDNLRIVHPKHNICDDLETLSNFWMNGKRVLLWNFDLFSTFETLPTEIVHKLITKADITLSHTNGTIVAFTFQAIPHRGLLAKLGGVPSMIDRVRQWMLMKDWDEDSVISFYQEKMEQLWQSEISDLPCLIQEALNFNLTIPYQGYQRVYWKSNGMLYKGTKSAESVMCCLIYRLRHSSLCSSHLKRKCDAELPPAKRRKTNIEMSETDILRQVHETPIIEDEIEYEVEEEIGSCLTCRINHFQHQLDAIKEMTSSQRGIINLCCGAGKTYIMKHLALSVNIAAIYAPSIALVEQIYENYFEEDERCHTFKINSANYEVQPKEVYLQLKASQKQHIVFIVNYQSYERFQLDFLEKYDMHLNISLFDEAHRITSSKSRSDITEQTESDTLNLIELKRTTKAFFFTATVTEPMKKYPKIYGPILFNYTFSQGVQDKIVKNFDTVISLCEETNEESNTETSNVERIINDICSMIKERRKNRVLIYTARVAESNSNSPSVKDLQKLSSHFQPFSVDFLSSSTTKGERKISFSRFSQEDDDVRILVSCRTISEGIDLVNCDMVVILDLSKSVVLVTQRGLRASRITHEERRIGSWENSIVYFPLNISRKEFFAFSESNDKRDYLNKTMKRSQYEYPMRVLNFIKNGLNMDIAWSIQKVASQDRKSKSGQQRKAKDVSKRNDRVTASVTIRLPPTEAEWTYDEEEIQKAFKSILVYLDESKCDNRSKKEKIVELGTLYPDKRPRSSGPYTSEEKKWGRFADWIVVVCRNQKYSQLTPDEINEVQKITYLVTSINKNHSNTISRLEKIRQFANLYPTAPPKRFSKNRPSEDKYWSRFLSNLLTVFRSNKCSPEEIEEIKKLPYIQSTSTSKKTIVTKSTLSRLEKLQELKRLYPEKRPRKSIEASLQERTWNRFVTNCISTYRGLGSSSKGFTEDELNEMKQIPYIAL